MPTSAQQAIRNLGQVTVFAINRLKQTWPTRPLSLENLAPPPPKKPPPLFRSPASCSASSSTCSAAACAIGITKMIDNSVDETSGRLPWLVAINAVDDVARSARPACGQLDREEFPALSMLILKPAARKSICLRRPPSPCRWSISRPARLAQPGRCRRHAGNRHRAHLGRHQTLSSGQRSSSEQTLVRSEDEQADTTFRTAWRHRRVVGSMRQRALAESPCGWS